ncbi:hypothetical protein NDU88_005282 [Pleurodeles waltl]|uniref:Uncharacterized protein n=1 Tax=Pleurodeles waltl TaxID=8319 RepID=A0AAV7QE78_PLEWA|nr:hypothetical protein NDU88_005256 [Pleurodeles waltl]KAJ1138902.1 hypothetical protein NDU88_005282 [Pleurodeles waltl]
MPWAAPRWRQREEEVCGAPGLGPVRHAPGLVRAGGAEVETVPPGVTTADGGLSLRECFPPTRRVGAGAPVPPKVRSESGGDAAGATTRGPCCGLGWKERSERLWRPGFCPYTGGCESDGRQRELRKWGWPGGGPNVMESAG